MTCPFYNQGKLCAQQPDRKKIDHLRVEQYCLSDDRSPTCVHRTIYAITKFPYAPFLKQSQRPVVPSQVEKISSPIPSPTLPK